MQEFTIMTDNTLKSQAFKLKGRLYTLTVFHLSDTNGAIIKQQLAEVVAKAPRLFDRTPVVIDCSAISENKLNPELFDFQQFCQILREFGLMPVAIQAGNSFINTIAQAQGLAVLNGSSGQDKSLQPAAEAIAPQVIKTKLLTSPVRSGQQIVSQGGDLVITASVSRGAELLADGNIHIYGTLRGRALAGISGNKQARIFCQSLDAELVSIAGFYRLRDGIEAINSPCQIFIQDDKIQIEAI
jgi:septum site-determining protein MinC